MQNNWKTIEREREWYAALMRMFDDDELKYDGGQYIMNKSS